MWLAIVSVIFGLAILVWSADQFIDAATQLAIRFNLPNFIIGVLILGIGTSAPEMVVSVLSAIDESPAIALGNAYGSNIINICLVLGITAIISPLVIRKELIRHDMMLLLLVTAIATWQLTDGKLSSFDGMLLILMLIVVLSIQLVLAMRTDSHDLGVVELPVSTSQTSNVFLSCLKLFVGLSLLIVSSRAIVWGAVELARLLGMSELLIGLTIVAIGTSLPELVASITAARRGNQDMALGNIIGSNLFNTLGVVGLAAIIQPLAIEAKVLTRDMLMVCVVTVMLFILCIVAYRHKGQLKVGGGLILVSMFIGYSFWLAIDATKSAKALEYTQTSLK